MERSRRRWGGGGEAEEVRKENGERRDDVHQT